jgi:predicted XRE-type DNA-binding protein
MSTLIDDERITPSSGNVFRDLGRTEPDLLLFKAHLAAHIAEAISRRGWTQEQAAARLEIDQPRVSHLIRGHLSRFSIDALLGYLKRLDVHMNLEIEDPVGEPAGKVLLTV